MIKNIIKNSFNKKKIVDFESIQYWESTTEKDVIEKTREYWDNIRQLRKNAFKARDIATLEDYDALNSLFAEEVMGWVWSEKEIVYIEELMPTGFMIREKIKTNVTHYTHKCVPVQLDDFMSESFTMKIIDRLKVSNIRYGLQPIESGYEVYCEKSKLSIYGKTLGEVMCKLAIITLSDAHQYN